MKFTLVITTYNSESYVESAIKSALNQVRKPDEIIICDDNSSDNTIEICKKYENELTIHVNKNGPSGYTGAYNYALLLGSGDFITILHFDDILHPDFFYQAEKGFSEYPACRFLVTQNFYFQNDFYNFVLVDKNEKPWLFLKGADYTKSYLEGVKINKHINRCPGTIFHRTLAKQLKFRSEAGLISDDDLFYRVGGFSDVLWLSKPFAGVRYHRDSESAKLDSLKISNILSQGYYFMVKDWREDSMIGQEGQRFFFESFFRHNFRTLYWASLHSKQSDINSAVNLNQDMRQLYKKQVSQYSKYYQRISFFLARNKMLFIDKAFFRIHSHIRNWGKRSK